MFRKSTAKAFQNQHCMKIIPVILSLLFYSFSYSQTYALIADRYIDCRNGKAVDHPTIIVTDHKITDINFTRSVPDQATIIDLKGYSLLPGLMDVHTHILAGTTDYDKDLYENSPSFRSLRAVRNLSLALQNGFTTLRDVCTECQVRLELEVKSIRRTVGLRLGWARTAARSTPTHFHWPDVLNDEDGNAFPARSLLAEFTVA